MPVFRVLKLCLIGEKMKTKKPRKCGRDDEEYEAVRVHLTHYCTHRHPHNDL